MLLSLYLIPFVLTLTSLRRSSESLGAFVVLTYILPLVVLTMLSSPGYALPGAQISEGTANAARGALHLIQFGMLTLLAATRGGPLVVPRGLWLLAAAAILAMVGSVLAVHGLALETASDGIARASLLAIQVANLFILIPHAASASGSAFLVGFARAFVHMAVGVLAVAVLSLAVVGPYPELTVRLGRPLNPRVLAEILVLGLFLADVSAATRNRRPIFALGIIATGSRLSISILCIYLIHRLWTRRDLVLRFAAIGLMVGGIAYVLASPLSFLLARSSILAGRWQIWRTGLELLGANWLWGRGERFVLIDPDAVVGQSVLRMHNAILESVLSHGIIFAAAVLTVYLLLAVRMYTQAPDANDPTESRISLAARWIIATAVAETLVGTAVWTNLGDGFSVALISFLSAAVVHLYLDNRIITPLSQGQLAP